jgi:hypothetical protein
MKTMLARDGGLDIPLGMDSLMVERIEQITVGVYLGRRKEKEGPYKDLRTLMAHGLMIRMTVDFDWTREIRFLWPDAVEIHQGNRTYLKVNRPKLGPNPCFYVADSRTVVCDEEPVIRRLLQRAAPSAPDFARGSDWKKVEHDLVAVVLDNRDGRIREATQRPVELDKDDIFSIAAAATERCVFGLANSDDFLLRTLVACHDPAGAQSIEFLISDLCRNTAKDMAKTSPESKSDDVRINELAIHVLKGFRVKAEGTTVRVEPSAGVRLAEFLALLVKNGL